MTGREFSPDEALAAGFLNRVVHPRTSTARSPSSSTGWWRSRSSALLATKAHTNAVTESMVGTGRSWADADGLEAGLRDPEGRAVRQQYLDRRG